MQTFLPFGDYHTSLSCLDDKRLGKQRVEAMQIIKSLENPAYGYAHHPVKLLWKDHIEALKYYHNIAIKQWKVRGFRNTMKLYELPDMIALPIFPQELHFSHQANLYSKDPSFYSRYAFRCIEPREYVWCEPVGETLVYIGE